MTAPKRPRKPKATPKLEPKPKPKPKPRRATPKPKPKPKPKPPVFLPEEVDDVDVPPVVIPPTREPSVAEIIQAARELEAALAVGAPRRSVWDWKTSILGILAVVASVIVAVLDRTGYEAPDGLVTLILGLLTGSGLIVAADHRDRVVPPIPIPERPRQGV